MDEVLFESLLAESEGVLLDFKAEQYPFSNVTPEEKYELAKDIVGFANATRRADSYILIGVKEQPSGPPTVVGIDPADQLQDHAVQQFLTGKLNRQVKFSSLSFVYQGKHVGIIRVDQHQDRPLFLTKDFGKLKKGVVYLRRGSSTGLDLPATPDEVAAMGRPQGGEPAELDVQFVGEKDRELKGVSAAGKFTRLVPPPEAYIPEFTSPGKGERVGNMVMYRGGQNKSYWRDFAKYLSAITGCVSLRIAISNAGRTQADNVRVELNVAQQACSFMTPQTLPDPPVENVLDSIRIRVPLVQQFRRSPGYVEAAVEGATSRLIVECGSIQPGRRVVSDPFYFSPAASGVFELAGVVFSSNLPRPLTFTLSVDLTVLDHDISVGDLQRHPEPPNIGVELPWVIL